MKETNRISSKLGILAGLFVFLNLLGCTAITPPPSARLQIDARALTAPLNQPTGPHVLPERPAQPSTTEVIAAIAEPPPKPAKPKPSTYSWKPGKAKKGPFIVVISLADQKAYIYRNGVRIAHSKVSTGKRGYETPTGRYKILQKKKKHTSNLYEDGDMPFMQRLTWDGIALHGGWVPNYPASHGCIRFPHSFARKLYGVTGIGSRVIIADYHPGDEMI